MNPPEKPKNSRWGTIPGPVAVVLGVVLIAFGVSIPLVINAITERQQDHWYVMDLGRDGDILYAQDIDLTIPQESGQLYTYASQTDWSRLVWLGYNEEKNRSEWREVDEPTVDFNWPPQNGPLPPNARKGTSSK